MLNKKEKILIIGFGKIGQRHYKNLLSLGYKNISVYDVDKVKLKKLEVKFVENFNKKILDQFDIAFVCNPTHLHIKTALQCAKAGCDIFIEKPLSSSLRSIKDLKKICAQKKLVAMIGCNMRFHPCLSFIKKYLKSKKLGKVYSIYHEFGENLTNWRSVKDYKKSYAAGKNYGGGIILDDIHEFDLLFWLNDFFGVKKSFFVCNNSGAFNLSIEDNCVASFEFKNNVLGSVRCDYLQKKYSRTCKIVGSKGVIEWDFNENIVWLHSYNKSKKLLSVKKYNTNAMYVHEIDYFLKSVNDRRNPMNNITEAESVLKYCVKR